MPIIYQDKRYRSYKHPILEHVFNKLTEKGTKRIGETLPFTLSDVLEGFDACDIPRPVSTSNIILDLTRNNGPIESRLPQSIIDYGYDLRKRTGRASLRVNYAGEFVYVGVGNALSSWHVWPEHPDLELIVKNQVPIAVRDFLTKDEGALFSVVDYCDVLSLALYGKPGTVIRVQNPMKWQPNEIDGLYFTDYGGIITLFPVEAKALSTKNPINMEQMLGAYKVMVVKRAEVRIVPLGIQMFPNGLRIGVFSFKNDQLELVTYIRITFDPPVRSWI